MHFDHFTKLSVFTNFVTLMSEFGEEGMIVGSPFLTQLLSFFVRLHFTGSVFCFVKFLMNIFSAMRMPYLLPLYQDLQFPRFYLLIDCPETLVSDQYCVLERYQATLFLTISTKSASLARFSFQRVDL